MNTFSNGFNSIFDELLQESKLEPATRFDFVPRANILESDKAYEVQLELAGFNKKDVKLHVDEGELKIEGTRKAKDPAEKSILHVNQIKEGAFQRLFNLPEDADGENIKAKMENGVLTVLIPKDAKRLLKRKVSVD